MGTLEFYYDLNSEPSRSVKMFLDFNKILYKPVKVDLIKGENLKNDYYKKVNPAKTVPAIKHGEFTLFESEAILIYLAAKFSTPDHWYPNDLKKQARINEYLHWHHSNSRWKGSTLVLMKYVIDPLFYKKKVKAEDQKAAIAVYKETLDAFERCFLKDYKFIAGNDISIADLMAVSELISVDCIGIYMGKNRPKIEAWHNNVMQTLGSAYDEAHKELYDEIDTLRRKLPPIDY